MILPPLSLYAVSEADSSSESKWNLLRNLTRLLHKLASQSMCKSADSWRTRLSLPFEVVQNIDRCSWIASQLIRLWSSFCAFRWSDPPSLSTWVIRKILYFLLRVGSKSAIDLLKSNCLVNSILFVLIETLLRSLSFRLRFVKTGTSIFKFPYIGWASSTRRPLSGCEFYTFGFRNKTL